MELQRLYGYRFGLSQRLSRLYQELEQVNSDIAFIDQQIEIAKEMEMGRMVKSGELDIADILGGSWVAHSVPLDGQLYQELELVHNEISIVDQKIEMIEDMEAREMADNIEYDLTTDDFVESWIEDSVSHIREIDDSEIEELE
jgi:hypothetical protein